MAISLLVHCVLHKVKSMHFLISPGILVMFWGFTGLKAIDENHSEADARDEEEVPVVPTWGLIYMDGYNLTC